jgi:hypothetical protein
MTCSTCNDPMFIVLADRAFCESCYREILLRQRRVIEDMPRQRLGKGEDASVFRKEDLPGAAECDGTAPDRCAGMGRAV